MLAHPPTHPVERDPFTDSHLVAGAPHIRTLRQPTVRAMTSRSPTASARWAVASVDGVRSPWSTFAPPVAATASRSIGSRPSPHRSGSREYACSLGRSAPLTRTDDHSRTITTSRDTER